MSFSQNLQFLRERAGMTQEQLAERMDVSRQSVSKWESAASYPEMEKLFALCDLFQVSLDTLARGSARESCVEDSARYDRHMNWFSAMVAGGVGIILLGVTAMLFLLGLGAAETVSVAVLLTMVTAAVAMLIVAGIRHDSFEKKNPVIHPFYTEEQLEGMERRFPILVAASVAAILIGVVWLILMEEGAQAAGEAAELKLTALFMLDIAGAVAVLVWAALQKGKYDIEEWNRKHDPSPEEAALRKRVEWYSGMIMLAATVVYLTVGFGCMALGNDYGASLGWRWGWIVYPIGGVLCAVAEMLVRREK